MRKYKTIILVLLLVLVPIKVYAVSDGGTFSGVNWSYEDGEVTISVGPTNMTNYMIRQPAEGSNTWIKYKNEIKKIIIEDGIDSILERSFQDYPNLEEVVLPKSMGGIIDDYAFYNCPKLKSIQIPIGLPKIGDYAFYGTGITEVELPIYLDWIGDHTFNENTNITRPSEWDNLIAAGTAGQYKGLGTSSGQREGYPSNNTCYNKYYFASFYDDTSYWKLDKEGTLTVWGTETYYFYSNSRVPWGCYKNQIKKIIINDDITGTIKIEDNNCPVKRNKIAVYASKPVDDIMNTRIRKLQGYLLMDHRDDPIYGYRNLETIIINRGVESITDNIFSAPNAHPNDIYVSKYVKKITGTNPFYTTIDYAPERENNFHINVSYEDYINHNYLYSESVGNFYDEDGNLKTVPQNSNSKGNLISDVDSTYVSIDDNSAPETIEVNGKTFYKYETYLTNEDGVAQVSLPRDSSIEYYTKVIETPSGCTKILDAVKVNSSKENIDEVIKVTNSGNNNNDDNVFDNPDTRVDNPFIYMITLVCSIVLIVGLYKRVRHI